MDFSTLPRVVRTDNTYDVFLATTAILPIRRRISAWRLVNISVPQVPQVSPATDVPLSATDHLAAPLSIAPSRYGVNRANDVYSATVTDYIDIDTDDAALYLIRALPRASYKRVTSLAAALEPEAQLAVVCPASNAVELHYGAAVHRLEIPVRHYNVVTLAAALNDAANLATGNAVFIVRDTVNFINVTGGATLHSVPGVAQMQSRRLMQIIGFAEGASRSSRPVDLSVEISLHSVVGSVPTVTCGVEGDLRCEPTYCGAMLPDRSTSWIEFNRPRYIDSLDITFTTPHGIAPCRSAVFRGTLEVR